MRYGGNIVQAYDCTHVNLPATEAAHPGAQLVGYSTAVGSFIGWTAAEFAAHPRAVHIDQHGGGQDDFTADYLDIEAGAGTPQMAAMWVEKAMQSYLRVERAMQRWPSLYMPGSMVHEVANALVAGKVPFPVGLNLAEWGSNQTLDKHLIQTAGGPFPIIGFQYLFPPGSPYGYNYFSANWLNYTAEVHSKNGGGMPSYRGSGTAYFQVEHEGATSDGKFELDSGHWQMAQPGWQVKGIRKP